MSRPTFKFEYLGENVDEEIKKNSYFSTKSIRNLLHILNTTSSEHQPNIFNYYISRSMDKGREPTKKPDVLFCIMY